MGAKVTFKIVSQTDGFNANGNKDSWVPEYKDGQLIFVEDLGRIYLDFHNERRCYSDFNRGVNYVGISKYDPTDNKKSPNGVLTLVDDTKLYPRINDMVVWGTKEYLYRTSKDEDGNELPEAWYEIGDEDSPTWN